MKVLTVSDIKLGCMRYVCGMNENILALSLLYVVSAEVLIALIIKLGCMRYLCSMNENILNLVLSPLCMVYKKSFYAIRHYFLIPASNENNLIYFSLNCSNSEIKYKIL